MKVQSVHGRTDQIREEEPDRQCKHIDIRDILENAHCRHVMVEKHVSQYVRGCATRHTFDAADVSSNPCRSYTETVQDQSTVPQMLTVSPGTVNNSMVLIRQSTDWTRVVFVYPVGLHFANGCTCYLPSLRSAGSSRCVNSCVTLLYLLCSPFLPRGLQEIRGDVLHAYIYDFPTVATAISHSLFSG
jgi:hypothetical protein